MLEMHLRGELALLPHAVPPDVSDPERNPAAVAMPPEIASAATGAPLGSRSSAARHAVGAPSVACQAKPSGATLQQRLSDGPTLHLACVLGQCASSVHP